MAFFIIDIYNIASGSKHRVCSKYAYYSKAEVNQVIWDFLYPTEFYPHDLEDMHFDTVFLSDEQHYQFVVTESQGPSPL